MVGSYCVHRVELDTEPDDVLEHAEGQRRDHKYIVRVGIKDPKNPKRKWLYFYSQARYQAYLNREAKPGDAIQLPNGKTGIVGKDVAAPNTMKRGQTQTKAKAATTAKPKNVDRGKGLLARLFGGGNEPTSASKGTGNNVVSNILAKLAEHRKKKEAQGDPLANAINNFAEAVKSKAAASKKAEADKRAKAAQNKSTPKPETKKPVAAAATEDDKKGKGKGGSGGGGGGSGSGKGGGSGSGKGGGSGKGSGKSDNAASYGSVNKLPKLKGDHDPDHDMKACNGDHDSSNCITYDLRRRGYDVTASNASFGDIKSVAAMYEGAQVAEEKDFSRLVAKLSKLKVGARGIMQFGNRMVIWSMEKGGITFRDCTDGKELNQVQLSKQKSFRLMRTDNCSPRPSTLTAVKAKS